LTEILYFGIIGEESRIKLPDGRFELTFGSVNPVNPVKKVRFGMG